MRSPIACKETRRTFSVSERCAAVSREQRSPAEQGADMASYQRMMGLLSLTVVFGCGAANDETASETSSVSVPIQSFSMHGAYNAFNGFAGCTLPKTIAGYEPT